MSRRDKALARLCRTPPSADIRWHELKAALEHLGYSELRNRGSRRKFFHLGKNALIICHQPHPAPCVDKACIADVIAHLKRYGFIED